MRRISVALILFLAATAQGQTVTLPKEVSIPTGRLGSVSITWDGTDCKWNVPPELDAFREYEPDAKVIRLRLMGNVPGRYRLFAVAAKDGKLSDFATCTIIIGEAPPVPPGPEPKPPGPTPDPAPIPVAGLRVLIVEETGERSKLPANQALILGSTVIRSWLNSACAKGADGKTPEYRIFDKDVSLAAESKVWQDAMARPRTQVPWLIISNGKTGYEGALPATVDETLALLKKFEK